MIIRAVFWISLIVMLVPVKDDRLNLHSQNVYSLRALSLIQSIASDVSGFCDRNPGSCTAASELVKNYGSRVQAHATQFGLVLGMNGETESKDQLVTGSVHTSN